MALVDRLRTNINTLLGAKGWTKAELARRAQPHGISRGYVFMIMRGEYDPGLEKIEALAKGFGLPDAGQLLSANPLGNSDTNPNHSRLIDCFDRSSEAGQSTILSVAEAQAAYRSKDSSPPEAP